LRAVIRACFPTTKHSPARDHAPTDHAAMDPLRLIRDYYVKGLLEKCVSSPRIRALSPRRAASRSREPLNHSRADYGWILLLARPSLVVAPSHADPSHPAPQIHAR
jgi:hypothetical protein